VTTKAKRLRELINADEMLVLPGAFDGIASRLVEQAGFDAIYFSGGLSASAFPGIPDFGVRTLSEAVAQVGGAAACTTVPILADGEAGYGSVLAVQRLVREMEQVGAGGLHFEDQSGARRCGHYAGKELVTAEEHAGRIRAAVAARQDPDFVIIARTDAVAVTGFEDAIARSRLYVEAGADVVFVDAPETMEQVEALPKLFDVPVMMDMVEFGKTPFLSAKELEKLGYALTIFPCTTFFAGMGAMRRALTELKTTGTSEGVQGEMATFREWQQAIGVDEAMAVLDLYGIPQESYQPVVS
jgi:2-methylisocitrate lyase-like PEP mutase family enzyme